MDQPTRILLDRYLAGEASPAELDNLREVVARDPAVRALAHGLAAEAARVRSRDVDAAWAGLRRRLEAPTVMARGRWWAGGGWLRAAAAVALVAGAVATWLATRRPVGAVAWREVVTARGERATLDLADGTRVVLAPETRLRLPQRFGGARETEIDGEVLFRVARDSMRPFRVRAAGAVVEVLGTTFAVRAYPGTPSVEVAVGEGRVSLSRASDSRGIVLGGGEVGRADSAGVLVIPHANLAPFLDWAEGRLVFDDAPLSEVLPRLGRWYGVTLVARAPGLAARRLSARFAGGSLAEVVATLETVLDAEAERRGDTVVLSARRRP